MRRRALTGQGRLSFDEGTQTNARGLKPKHRVQQASRARREKAQAGAAEALAKGRTDALDHDAILSLQRSAGNAAVAAAVAPAAPVPHRGAFNASGLFAAEAPALVPLIPQEQLKAIQAHYDVIASNSEVQRRWQAMKKRRDADEYPLDQAWTRKLDAIAADLRPVPDAPLEASVPTASVLDPDIQKAPLGDEAVESAFRKSIVDELLKTATVTVRIADRALSAMERGDDGPYTKPEILLECGAMKLPHTKGKVTFADLTSKPGAPYAHRYLEKVTKRPEVVEIRNDLIELETALADAEVEHKDLQERGKTHPVVKATAEFLGGPSLMEIQQAIADAKKHPEKGTIEEQVAELKAPEPPLTIWDEPKLAARQAGDLLAKHEVPLAAIGLMRAQHVAAISFSAYSRYEERVMKGAGVAVKWLERAKEAGKLAVEVAASEVGLGPLAKAGLVGAYGFAQGVAERKEGKTTWDLAKDAGVDAAMSYLGDKFKEGFSEALKERFAVQLKAYPDLYHRVIESTAGMSAAFYKTPMEAVTKRIITGGKLPKNTAEWADMVAKETLTEATAGASGSELNQALTKFVIKMTGSEPKKGGGE